MKVLGIYASPRSASNSDILLDRALEGARSVGAEVEGIYVRDLDINACAECGGCDRTGECVVGDEMQGVYPKLLDADAIIISSPVFFYGPPSQVKALIDRCQALWNRRILAKKGEALKRYDGGRGFLIAVGATKGEKLFDAIKLIVKYFFDALDMSFEDGLYFKGIEARGEAANHPEALEQAFEFGKKIGKEI